MDKIDSLDKINGFVSDIRSLRKGYLSNFFLDRKKHSIWIEKGELFLRFLSPDGYFSAPFKPIRSTTCFFLPLPCNNWSGD